MAWIRSLKLHSFRSYQELGLSGLHSGLLVFSGRNGAGKTNILEAVSLLSPGRGLRGAKLAEIQRRDDDSPWAVAAEVQTGQEAVRLGTGLDPERLSDKEKRVVRVNGRTAKGQSFLADYLSIVWLTPQMDRLFLESSRERRRFLDRLVFGFDPGHSGRVVRYENAVAQRSRLLREGRGDSSWLAALEQLIAETGTAIAAARLDFVSRLQSACEDSRHAPFPEVRISITGFLEEMLLTHKALETETLFRERMLESRERDAVSGGMRSGPHKSDMNVVYFEKDMPAAQCSTGEQKALLTGIVLAHARVIAAERGEPPLLLLDEVAAHLDEGRRAALYDILHRLGAQVWLTGTDLGLFEGVKQSTQFFDVQDSHIRYSSPKMLSFSG